MAVTCHQRAQLRAPDIHIWLAHVDDRRMAAEYLTLLDDVERDRAERFLFERDRSRFPQSHGILRSTLSGYLDLEASDLTFLYGQSGKPRLIPLPGQPSLEFSLSHSGDYCVVAVGLGNPLGVDIEEIRDLPQMIDIARQYFSLGEFRQLASLTGALQRDAFFALWTRKEAMVKALGQGLDGKLDQIESGGKSVVRPQIRSEGEEVPTHHRSVTQLSLLPGYAAAVASLQPHVSVTIHTWNIAATT